jgi:hypothetical protein
MTKRCEIRLEEVTRFEEELNTAYRDLPKTHIANADESMWLLLFWQRRKIVADTGVEGVKIEIHGDLKAPFILIGSMSAKEDTFPLFLVAIWWTSRCYEQRRKFKATFLN